MRRALRPLRHRPFRLLAGGQLASNIGDALYAVALPWYVLAAHGGALLLGSVLAIYGLARTVMLAIGGHASDRFKPWTVMMSADLVRACAVAGLASACALSGPRLAVLAPIAVVLGAGAGLFLPGSFSIIPSLLPDEDLKAGNALSSAMTQLSLLVGPAIGGGIVALLGPTPAFALDAGSFVISGLTLAGIRTLRQIRGGATASAVADASAPGSGPTLRRLLATEPVLWIIFAIDIAATSARVGSARSRCPRSRTARSATAPPATAH